jgi:hypothetical protein
MAPTRRQFIRQLGIMLASLIAAGCVPEPTPTFTQPCVDFDTSHRAEWEKLRQLWLGLPERSDLPDPYNHQSQPGSSWFMADRVLAEYRTVLEALVEAEEIDTGVAEQMEVAFWHAVYHLESVQATCYMPGPPFVALVRDDLLDQRCSLLEASGDLDPETVEQVQSAIALDVAFFETMEGVDNPYAPLNGARRIERLWESGRLEASSEAAEAACILVDLLLEGG